MTHFEGIEINKGKVRLNFHVHFYSSIEKFGSFSF